MGNEGKDIKMTEFKPDQDRIKWTFWSILLMNWILIGVGIVMFGAAVYSAVGLQRWDLTGVLSLTGFGDILTVFKWSMDRVQRSLGDQVQVHTAMCGYVKQMDSVKQEPLKSVKQPVPNADDEIGNIERINEEIRRATLYSMELIQDFTKIAEPLKEKPWIRAIPIRYDKLKMNGAEIGPKCSISKDQKITLSGSLRNVSNKRVKINAIVIAVRPPMGTPDGGPFRFDFYVDERVHVLLPYQPLDIVGPEKSIAYNAKTRTNEEIPKDWYDRRDWYAFMTCQTEDGCWHDDHNKYWFEVKETELKKQTKTNVKVDAHASKTDVSSKFY